MSTWYGLWASRARRSRSSIALPGSRQGAENPKLQTIWKEQTRSSAARRRSEFAKRIRAEIEKWQKVVDAAGVKLD